MGEDEFTAFYAANKDRCLRAAMAYGMGAEAAEDAVAEAFSRAWARWRQVRVLQSPSAWVVRTAINADISWWRRRRREAPHADGQADVPARGQETQIEVETDLLAAIRGLPPRQREVVVLRYLLDLDTVATAQSLDIAPGTVTATLHRALKTLRDQLDCKERSLP
ncbi:MAG: sigma-70 family RNA polymerase sigma factor [Nocardioides sp.]|uniref:sigma-70 family RNA polymerase sigma factor n=1 Tax=Nocardioides sp. TaxID=35761 RepID=UPI0039E43C26